ncbi:MAG TPA: ferrochelatase [Syntrophorhabdales bacterium]|nr:ferrochelatase [Syntrophorhabdales bacterium]
MKKSAVLLVSFGGPRSIDDVPGFIQRLTGRKLPPAVEQQIVERYRLIGGCSPLPAIAEEHARLLEKTMGGELGIRPAFKYSYPSIEERIDQCKSQGIDRIFFFVMTPFYTSRTAGEYIATAKRHLDSIQYHPGVVFIHSWYNEPGFVRCWISRIEESLVPDAFYLFSAHSLPTALADEPYKRQIEQTVHKVVDELRLSHYGLGWQSIPAGTTEPWIGPTVETVLDKVAEEKFRVVVQVPIGFVTEHVETLYDIDVVHKKYAAAKGLSHRRVACLNTDPPFIEVTKKILLQALQKAA